VQILAALQAQDRLDDATDGSPIGSSIKLLASIARHLRKQRIAAGALTLASAEVKVTLNETHDPLDVKAYETRETNSMVEEVNQSCCRHVSETCPVVVALACMLACSFIVVEDLASFCLPAHIVLRDSVHASC
jgi:hypothetical protein